MTDKPETLSLDFDKDDFAPPSGVSDVDIVVDIPKPSKRNRDLSRLRRDTFIFEKDYRKVVRTIVAIVVIAVVIVVLVYYLLHQ